MKPKLRHDGRGFTLMEIMVTLAVSGIVIISSMSIMTPLMNMKSMVDRSLWTSTVVGQFRTCVNSKSSWDLTVAESTNTSLACLRDAATAPCTNKAVGEFSLLNGLSKSCIEGYDTKSGTSGFQEDGQVCTTYSATGNDQCPYKYTMQWTPYCPLNAATCTNPSILIEGRMSYNPATEDKKNRGNLDRYSLNVLKNSADKGRFFSLTERMVAGSVVGQDGVGISKCSPLGENRVFNPGTKIDTGGYVQEVTADGGIKLNVGTYFCHISAPAFKVGSHKALLLADSDVRLTGTSEYSPDYWGQTPTRSEIIGAFTVSYPQVVHVKHFCSRLPEASEDQNTSMGIPMLAPSATSTLGNGNSDDEVYTTLWCWVISGN